MLKSKYIAIILLILLIAFLSACKDEESLDAESETEIEEETEVEEEEEPEPVVEELTTEEAQEIVQTTIDELMERFQEVAHNNPEIYGIDFDAETKAASDVIEFTSESLSDLATKKYVENFAPYYLEAFTCDCDAYELLHSSMAVIGFKIVNQDKNSFEATSKTIGNDMYPGPGATYSWYFKNEDDVWKIDDVSAISAEEEPLNLTFDELDNYFDNTEFVDEIDQDGDKYIVVKHVSNDSYQAYNVMTGALNYELTMSYREKDAGDQAEEEDSEEVEETEAAEELSEEAERHENELAELNNPTFIHKYREYDDEYGDLGKREIKIPQFGIDGLDQHLYEKYIAGNEDLSDIGDVTPTDDSSRFTYDESDTYGEVYQHGKFVSVLMNSFLYEGGVNGMYAVTSINYDLDNDEAIKLEDVLGEKSISFERLDELVKEKLKGEEYQGALFPDYESSLDSADDYRTFYATDDQIVIIFNIYHIAPRTSGLIEVPIGWDEF